MRTLFFVSLLSACFGGSVGLPEVPPLGTPGSKIVWRFEDIPAGGWRFSVYAKPFDLLAEPVRLAVASDGTGCPIPSTSPWWSVARESDNLPCPEGWRIARRWSFSPFSPLTRRRILPPRNADSAWAAVKSCASRAGVKEYASGRLRDVKWYETSEWEEGDYIDDSTALNDNVVIGLWLPPDTILLARRARTYMGTYHGWAVMHELLHHLMRGPPKPHVTHPYVPMAMPCEIMAWQHVGEWYRRPLPFVAGAGALKGNAVPSHRFPQ